MGSGGRVRSCAWSCAALVAVAIAFVAAVLAAGAWYLFRDTPERVEEAFPTDAHARYLRIRLRPDDDGMRRLAVALFERGEEALFHGPAAPSWLRTSREEGWLAMLPATFEWGAGPGDPGVARVRFEGNHSTARALFRVLRWGAGTGSGRPGTPRAVDLDDGVPVVRLPLEDGGNLEVAFVGNRLLASRIPGAIETVLSSPPESASPPARPGPGSFPREDGHGWIDLPRLGEGCRVRLSLLLESDDLLRFRAGPGERCGGTIAEERRGEVSDLLRAETADLAAAAGLEPTDEPGVAWSAEGRWTVSGRLAGIRDRALRAFPALASPSAAQPPPDGGR